MILGVNFCTRSEIIVIGIHSQNATDRGDYQTFLENMNLVGCWNQQDTVKLSYFKIMLYILLCPLRP